MKDENLPQEGTHSLPPHVARRLRYQMLCWLWSFPSLGAAVILLRSSAPWGPGRSLLDILSAVTLEAWIALSLLGAHMVWFCLWRREETQHQEKLQKDPQNEIC